MGWNFISTEISGCPKALDQKPHGIFMHITVDPAVKEHYNYPNACPGIAEFCPGELPEMSPYWQDHTTPTPLHAHTSSERHEDTALFSQASCKIEGSPGVAPCWSQLTENSNLRSLSVPRFIKYILFYFYLSWTPSVAHSRDQKTNTEPLTQRRHAIPSYDWPSDITWLFWEQFFRSWRIWIQCHAGREKDWAQVSLILDVHFEHGNNIKKVYNSTSIQ